MIANIPYNQVIQDFKDTLRGDVPWVKYRGKWVLEYNTNTQDLHVMLDTYGIRSNQRWRRYNGDEKSLPELSILAINYKQDNGWHWVVCERDGYINIYDPWSGVYGWSSDLDIHAFVRVHS